MDINTLAVYLGSSGRARQIFKDAAQQLGHLIGENGKSLVYGGMDAGLMGILARNALESGAEVTGIIPKKLKDIERELQGLTETIIVDDLWDRKKRMFQRADAIVSLPGGYGTMDESLEVLYWGNLGLHDKPLVLVNIDGYWDIMIDYIHGMPDFDERFLVTVDSVEDVFPALENWTSPPLTPPPAGGKSAKHSGGEDEIHLPHFEDEITRDTDDPIVIDKASIENTYYAICALGLKQLDKHQRHIGFLNTDSQFDKLISWFKQAEKENFVTEHCLELFSIDEDESLLREKLENQKDVRIDLHREKWGDRRETERD